MHDVIVAGSGLVALTAAHALAQEGSDVLLLTKAPIEIVDPAAVAHKRAIALSAGSLAAFERWGLAAKVPAGGQIHKVHVSMAGRVAAFRMDAKDLGVPCLGQVVCSHALHDALRVAVFDRNMPVHVGDVMAVHCGADSVSIDTTQGRCEATCLVVAEGLQALLKNKLGWPTVVEPYGQTALSTTVQTDRAHAGVAYERFLPIGPLALLPTAEPREMAMVWAMRSDLIASVAGEANANFNQALQQAFGFALGRLRIKGQLRQFPLQRRRTRPLAQPGLVLLGNAASVCHPVAGQGLNLAIRDIKRLCVCSKPLGELRGSMWRRYQHTSASDHGDVLGLTDFLAKHVRAQTWAAAGAWCMDFVPGLKPWVAEQAMGFR